jgi:hypothetical protein
MWKSYPEYNRSIEEWLQQINSRAAGSLAFLHLKRTLKRATRDKVITNEEQQNLWKMILASNDDCYTALLAIESKYKLLKEKL